MENKLDNLFKNKLREREVVFNDTHWEQAQFLLDKQEESDRRRAWWWYSLGGLLGLVLIGGLAWYWMATDDVSQIGEKPLLSSKEQLAKNVEKDFNQTDSKLIEALVENENTSITITTDFDKLTILKEKKALEKTKTNFNSTADKTTHYSSAVDDKNKTTLAVDFSLKNEISQASGQPHKNEKAETITKEIKPHDDENTVSNQALNGEIDSKLNSHLDRESPQKNTTLNQVSDSELDSELNKKLDRRNSIFITNELKMLETPHPTLEDVVPTMVATKIQPFTQKGWRLGITFSVLMYPYSNSSDVQFSDFPDINPNVSAKHFTGFKLGASVAYQLNHNWALGTELLYYQQTGTFQSVRSSRQIQYRFGVDSTTFELVPQHLHYLEIPLFIQRKWNKHALEMGLSTDFLLGVRNAIGTYQTNNMNRPSLEKEASTWGYKDGFAKWHFRGLLGYQYQISTNIKMGLRMNVILGNGILDKNYDAPFRFILLESRPINFELKMSYRF